MATNIPEALTLPHSKAKIKFTQDYHHDKLADLTRRLIADEKLAAHLRKNPTHELSKLGIVISDEDRHRVTDEDILAAMGHRGPTSQFNPVLVIVVVVVAVINVPQPAE